jgi:plastocyanin
VQARWIASLAWGALLLAAASLAALADSDGAIRGKVSLGVKGLPLAAVAPVVVYLEPLDGVAADGSARPPGNMHQHDARFSPSFLVVAAGQTVQMANDDAIYHNVFSYSRPNDFDLGLYPAGETRKLVLRHPGVVKLYCSIHESMNATILVAPTAWYDVVKASGSYALTGVRPGKYRAVVWAERLPPTARVIELGVGQQQVVDWVIGAPG